MPLSRRGEHTMMVYLDSSWTTLHIWKRCRRPLFSKWAAMKGNDGRSKNRRVHGRRRNSRKKLCLRTKIGNSFCAIDIFRKCVWSTTAPILLRLLPPNLFPTLRSRCFWPVASTQPGLRLLEIHIVLPRTFALASLSFFSPSHPYIVNIFSTYSSSLLLVTCPRRGTWGKLTRLSSNHWIKSFVISLQIWKPTQLKHAYPYALSFSW